MTRAACSLLSSQELLAYWVDELDAVNERRLDEHLFACGACSARLHALVELGAAIRRTFVEGWLTLVLPEQFIRRMKDAGFRVREYRFGPSGSVNCTITPEDDFVVGYFPAALGDVRRLDMLIDDTTSGKFRVTDVAFDPSAPVLVTVTSSVYLRTLQYSRQHVRLVAVDVDGAHERVLGEYTFNHSPS